MLAKAQLQFKLLLTVKIAGGHLLVLNLTNAGSSILKDIVVRLDQPDLKSPVDCVGCFIYALMPNADENVTFRIFASSLKRAHFSVSG